MTKLALIHDATTVSTAHPGGWFELPDGSRSSPAQDGWSNGDFRLAAIQPADPVPEGKVVVSTSVELLDGQPKYVHVLEDNDLIAYTAQKRWEKEVGGTMVGGMSTHTDDRSKSLIMGARMAAEADPDFTTDWKAADGSFVTIDAATIIAVSNAVLAHVANCFAIEAQVIDAIGSGAITTTGEVDAAFAAAQ